MPTLGSAEVLKTALIEFPMWNPGSPFHRFRELSTDTEDVRSTVNYCLNKNSKNSLYDL